MKRAAWTRLLALLGLLVAGCKQGPPADLHVRAGDAGFVYAPDEQVAASPVDAGEGPRLELVVGLLGGPGNLDGTGTLARMGRVSGGACVGETIWAADDEPNALRRIDVASGRVTRVALHWDPAPAVAFDLTVSQLVPAGLDRLFVSDRTHHVLAEVSTTAGTARVVAGRANVRGSQDGTAADALFDNPLGLALTPAGDLYVADMGNRVIRRVDPKTGAVTTVARGFHAVWGLAWADDAGLFATDALIDAVLHVDPVSGQTEIVAGGHHSGLVGYQDGPAAKARFWQPGSLAYVPQERALYIVDKDNGLVRRLSLETHQVDTVAGRLGIHLHDDGTGEAAGFANLGFVAACYGRAMLVGDEASVRQIETTSHRVTTLAGQPSHPWVRDGAYARGQLHGPDDGALVGPSTMLATECVGETVRIVDLAHDGVSTLAGFPYQPGFLDGVGLAARFRCPSAVASDGKGVAFVADRDNHAIRAIDLKTGSVSTVAGTASTCGAADGPFATATLCAPDGLAVVGDALFVSDAGSHTVRRLDLVTQVVTTLSGHAFERGALDGRGDAARFSSPRGIAALPDGSLVVADRENDLLRTIDPHTGVTSILCPEVHFRRPSGVSAAGDAVLVTEGSVVHALHPATCRDRILVGVPGVIGVQLGALPQSLNEPVSALYSSETGSVLVVDHAENAIVRAVLGRGVAP